MVVTITEIGVTEEEEASRVIMITTARIGQILHREVVIITIIIIVRTIKITIDGVEVRPTIATTTLIINPTAGAQALPLKEEELGVGQRMTRGAGVAGPVTAAGGTEQAATEGMEGLSTPEPCRTIPITLCINPDLVCFILKSQVAVAEARSAHMCMMSKPGSRYSAPVTLTCSGSSRNTHAPRARADLGPQADREEGEVILRGLIIATLNNGAEAENRTTIRIRTRTRVRAGADMVKARIRAAEGLGEQDQEAIDSGVMEEETLTIITRGRTKEVITIITNGANKQFLVLNKL